MKKIVHKIEEGQDRKEVLCTTYQMRNCFRQFFDGCASELDVHCYFQHAFAADLCPKSGTVLDVCCGRGLLLPFLRYRGKPPRIYVGVDIHPKNAVWSRGLDPRDPTKGKDWGFETVFVESNVAKMAGPLLENEDLPRKYNLIVYTSAIEHMQPADQIASLEQARKVAGKKTTLYLTCPITEEGVSGYECQFAAHVYEPTSREIQGWLKGAGWSIHQAIGLATSCKRFRKTLKGEELKQAEEIYSIMPRQQALPTIGALYPECATEVAYVCTIHQKGLIK